MKSCIITTMRVSGRGLHFSLSITEMLASRGRLSARVCGRRQIALSFRVYCVVWKDLHGLNHVFSLHSPSPAGANEERLQKPPSWPSEKGDYTDYKIYLRTCDRYIQRESLHISQVESSGFILPSLSASITGLRYRALQTMAFTHFPSHEVWSDELQPVWRSGHLLLELTQMPCLCCFYSSSFVRDCRNLSELMFTPL